MFGAISPAEHFIPDPLHSLAHRRRGRGEVPVGRAEAEDVLCRAVGVGQLPLGIEDDDRVGKAVDGGLRCQLEDISEVRKVSPAGAAGLRLLASSSSRSIGSGHGASGASESTLHPALSHRIT